MELRLQKRKFEEISDELGRIYALFLASVKTWIRYPWASTFYIVNSLLGAIVYAYLGSAVKYSGVLPKNIDYLAYLIVGMAFFSYLHESIGMAGRIVDPWKLEHQLITPIRLHVLLVGSSLWYYILNAVSIAIYLSIGCSFSVSFNVNLVLFLAITTLAFLVMCGLGMIAAGFQIITKEWNPVTWVLNALTMLAGGVYFPPEILPSPFRYFSQVLPQYYLLDLFRSSLLLNPPIFNMIFEILKLSILAFTLFPLGYFILKKSIEKARKDGTLGFF